MNKQNNPISTKQIWNAQREQARSDSAGFHARIAKQELFWFLEDRRTWVKHEGSRWLSLKTDSLGTQTIDLKSDFQPWVSSFDDSEAPFFRWFKGGLTNACFNEVDAHVLRGRGGEKAFVFEGDRWDPSLNSGKGGPVFARTVTRKELLVNVVRYALVLKNLGLKKGDVIAINMPNILDQIFYIEAAKRLGVIYTCVFGGFSARTLSDRIEDSGAKVLITTDGAYRNAQVVPFKQSFADPALDNYIPLSSALQISGKTFAKWNVESGEAKTILGSMSKQLEGEITVERSEVMTSFGRAIETLSGWDISKKSSIRTALVEALLKAPSRVLATIVVKHASISDLSWQSARDRWSHDLLREVDQKLAQSLAERSYSKSVDQIEKSLTELPDEVLVKLVAEVCPVEPLDSEFPLFIIYTSGSTGKPKGVVHTTGGYVSGIAHTMRIAFNVDPEAEEKNDVILVVADPGWITGQSYMISAALTTRTTSIIAEGSPLFPHAGRFTSMIERHKVTIFKAGSTFLKTVASNEENLKDIQRYDRTTLKVGTFCAEPTSPSIQELAMKLLTPFYSNSYWATEHGGIIFTHFFGNSDMPVEANAHSYPLPWIFPEVRIEVQDKQTLNGGLRKYRFAKNEERGELVITKPYPYLARTIWGDRENVGKKFWKGDIERFKATYFSHWAKDKTGECVYTQGDFASHHEDHSFSFHGRSDDVINTSGHRIGTEEIESALLRDRQINPKSPVANVIVVGAPHEEKGTVPLAFVMTDAGKQISVDDEARLNELVREMKGGIAVPAGYLCLSQFPETRSGKYMRRFLRNIVEHEPLGDRSTLKNPEALDEVEAAVRAWETKSKLSMDQSLLEVFSTLRVENHEVSKGQVVAILTIGKPPVNALDERTLDELHGALGHLSRRPDVKAVVVTGQGTRSFIAGADIRQLLEEMHTVDQVLPLSRKCAEITGLISAMEKPVIAAINGVALGGGNEFLLSTHYKVAEPHARFGQPEINLNLIPGYGGTQRLPRLLFEKSGIEGLLEAIEIVVGGRELDAERALSLGIIDEVVSSTDALTRAVNLAIEYVNAGSGPILAARKYHQQLNEKWKRPLKFPSEICESSRFQRLKKQASVAGRDKAFSRAFTAVQDGFEQPLDQGIKTEAEIFATAVVDAEGGKKGIREFFERRSSYLPTRTQSDLDGAIANEKRLLETGDLLSVGAPFFPGVTKLPKYQYCYCVERNPLNGAPEHGDPIKSEKKKIVPVGNPKADEVLLFMLTSEINFNDIWALTGVPVSPFDIHDDDWHVTGSGGLALVVSAGESVRQEGRVKVGDLVSVFAGQSEVLSPTMGLDPMFANQKIQGYETGDGSHQQFMIAQAPQVHSKPADLFLEDAGSYILNLGTIYRALFTVLDIESGKTLFVEGAATGTGAEAVKVGAQNGLSVCGLVSSVERERAVLNMGAKGAINRTSADISSIFTRVPEDSAQWDAWEKQGLPYLSKFKEAMGGRLADYVISHAGESTFPRSYQLLEENGILAYFGASTGFHFTFMGKPGECSPMTMIDRVQLRAGASILVFYGRPNGDYLDSSGIECIEACREMRARIVVCTYTDGQKEYVKSLGFGGLVAGVFSVEEIRRKEGSKFQWHDTMPQLPDPKSQTKEFREAVRVYQEYTFKPFVSYVVKFLKSVGGGKDYPDFIFERAHQDTLALSTMVVKPFTGRVLYFESMKGRRYSFYAPQVWMRQRRIYMATSNVWGTHLNNSYEVECLHRMIQTGNLSVTAPAVVPFDELPTAHQEMWENKHKSANYVLNHALPLMGLKTKDELFKAWAREKKQ